MTAKRTPDWRLTLPRWIADEILDARAPDVIEALTAHVALPDGHAEVKRVAVVAIKLESGAWDFWGSKALAHVRAGDPVPTRPDEDPIGVTVGRVPKPVRDALQARAEALGFRHTVYAAAVIMRAELRQARAPAKKAT